MRIDLNCDMGESFGVYTLGYDEAAMPFVTSVNVACGFHASDPVNMMQTVKKAKQYNLAIGAHPSFPDLVGFGRRVIIASNEEIFADIVYQIGALNGFCQMHGIKMQHVKVHGAMYNMAEKDIAVGIVIAEAIKSVDPDLYMVCSCGSPMVKAAQQVGVNYVEEAFADRAYTPEGKLVARSQPGAVIHDVKEVAARVLTLVKTGKMKTIDGSEIELKADTICVHGDTPGAVEMIKEIRKLLEQEGISLKAFGKK